MVPLRIRVSWRSRSRTGKNYQFGGCGTVGARTPAQVGTWANGIATKETKAADVCFSGGRVYAVATALETEDAYHAQNFASQGVRFLRRHGANGNQSQAHTGISSASQIPINNLR